jgi:hypothetical protein
MDKQHEKTTIMQQEHVAWTCNMDQQHRQAACTGAAQKGSRDMQREHATRTCSMDKKHGKQKGHVEGICSMAMQHKHET